MKTTAKGLLLVQTLALAGGATAASAQTRWERHHPRRDQVDDRLANQDRRIHREAREGEPTRAQARGLHQQDRMIRAEARAMARAHGGRIGRGEQRFLNAQENATSRRIGH